MHAASLSLRLVAIVLALLCTSRAFSQATQGSLPDPITTPELMRYADRLGLSSEQQRAAQRLHDEYREEFRTLRENEISAFLDSMRGMQGTMPSRNSFEDFMRTRDRLLNRIAQVDDRLLMRMQDILTDQQKAMLPRVRMARERARYAGMQGMMGMGRGVVDLTTIVDDVGMQPAERQAIDPALASYEHRLTRGMRDMHEAGNQMFVNMFEAFEAAGITEDTMEDPAQMAEVMETVQDVMMELIGSIMERGRELNELGEQSFNSMKPFLSEDTARAMRNMYYTQAYPGVSYALHLPVEPKLDAAIALDQISDRLRESIRALRAEARHRADRVLDDALELAKDQQENMNPFGGGDVDWQEIQTRSAELHKTFSEINTDVQQRLLSMLAEEVDQAAQQEVAQAEAEAARPRGRRSPFGGAVAAPSEADSDAPARSPHDQHLPKAISGRDMKIYIRMLDLDEGLTAVAEELHAAYLERFEAATKESFEKIKKNQMSMWGGEGDPDPAAADRRNQLRRQTLDIILATDNGFFDDLAQAMPSDEQFHRVERARQARLRDVYSAQSPYYYDFGNSNAASKIDLTRIIRLASLPDDAMARIDAVLAEYEREVIDALKQQYEATLELTAVQERFQIESMLAAKEDNSSAMADGMRYMELMREPQKHIAEISERLAELNEATVTELLHLLQGEHAAALEQEYRRRAFPNVYNDPAAMDKHIRSAMQLPDLSEPQRTQLAELLGEYRPRYTQFSEQMVEISRKSTRSPHMGFEAEEWQEYMDIMEQMQRVRFERNELNAKAITQLKTILNDTQLRALGPLPEPVEDNDMWGF